MNKVGLVRLVLLISLVIGQITPNDAEVDGVTLNSSTAEIKWAIIFNVTSGEDGSQISNFNINCNNSFSASGVNSPYEAGFLPGSYECTFSKEEFYNRAVIFTADNDKTVNVKLSRERQLTTEEHTWLEAIYNCLYSGDCSLYNLLLEVNKTVGNIWEHTKPTDQSVVTFRNITNKVVDSEHNLTIDYNINIPIKAGYVSGTYLPVRIGYWFLNTSNTTCYNQGDKPTGVEDPYCQPLIIETLGPMGGSVSFTTKLRPGLPAGEYSIKEMVDIDPNNVWINYGQEVIGTILVTKTISDYGIGLEKTGETMPRAETSSGASSSNNGGTKTIVEREIIKLVPQEETSDKDKTDNNKIIHLNKPTITGGVIGTNLLSGGGFINVIAILCGTFIIFIIITSKTVLRLKKKVNNILSIFFIVFLLLILINLVSGFSLSRNTTWSSNLEGIGKGSLAFGDIDNDGDLDLVMSGYNNSVIAKIYINNGTTLTESQQWQSNLTNITRGSLAFGDIDNDGDLDLALTGCTSDVVTLCDGDRISKIYINNGTSLVENNQWQQNLTAVYWGSLAFGDIDNDGRLDLALTGSASTGYVSKIYINNGTSLVESNQWQNSLTGVYTSAVAFSDIDNDGDLDLALSGLKTASPYRFSVMYLNNGSSLIESIQWWDPYWPLGHTFLAFGDVDNDGDLDLIHMGAPDHLFLFINNGSNLKEYQNDTISGGDQLTGIFDGALAFGDIDNDGDLDLATMGMEENRLGIYQWNETGFVRNDSIGIDFIADDMQKGSLAFIDINNDFKLDLACGGYSYGDGYLTKIYINNITTTNTKPLPPNSSFSSTYINNILTLSWENGSDTETNTSGLYYNLMVGNATNNHTIVSGIYGGSSNPTAGYFGNMMQRKSISLNVQLEANKTYYWHVQTIDTGLAKSNWSAVQNFTISLDTTKPNITINYPSPNASLHTTNPYFIFNATVTDANLTNVTLYVDFNGTMIANGTNSSGLNGTYTFNRNLTNYADGQYSWYIEANDSSNNSQTSGTRSFYLDRAYPIVRLISPTNASSWTSSSTVTFSYNVTDTDIANCSLIIDGSIDQTDSSVEENTTQTFTKTLANGNYNWQVNCTDYVGYTNSSEIRSLTVNYVAPSDGGNGGGGGHTTTTITSFWSQTYIVKNEEFEKGYTKQLAKKERLSININNITHYVGLVELTNTTATINVSSTPTQAIMNREEEKKFEVTDDNFYDLLVKLNSINVTSNKANITIKSIHEEIPTEEKKKAEEKPEEKKEEIEGKKNILKSAWVWLVVIGIVIIFVSIKFLKRYIKYKQWRKYSFVE